MLLGHSVLPLYFVACTSFKSKTGNVTQMILTLSIFFFTVLVSVLWKLGHFIATRSLLRWNISWLYEQRSGR